MIGVVADDLSGAAEIGAVGLRHGLSAEILASGQPSEGIDLVCVDTDSRACSAEAAGQRAAAATVLLQTAGAEWIYKKVDSVLRGQVTAELEAILNRLGLDSALLVPANPLKGRVIHGGRYWIADTPLDETEFRRDPDYPRTSAEVMDLLSPSTGMAASVCSVRDQYCPSGIVVGEVESTGDLQYWATRRHSDALMAGGSEFFDVLLGAERVQRTEGIPARPIDDRTGGELVICGSASETTVAFVREARERDIPVFSLPDDLAQGGGPGPEVEMASTQQILPVLKSRGRVILQTAVRVAQDPATGRRLMERLTQQAASVIRDAAVAHIYVEGGATAALLLKRMGWERLRVVGEMAPGVVTLVANEASAPLLTIKPGSYQWPNSLLQPAFVGS